MCSVTQGDDPSKAFYNNLCRSDIYVIYLGMYMLCTCVQHGVAYLVPFPPYLMSDACQASNGCFVLPCCCTITPQVNCNGLASNEATVTLTPAARSGIGGWQAPGVGAGRRRDRLSSDTRGGRHGHIAALEDVVSSDYEEDNWEDYSAV